MNATFPRLMARDLTGRDVSLPAGLPGELTVVVVAFRRGQQKLVDSWLPWLDQMASADARLRYVELPTIGQQWALGRSVIDGGMAASIGDEVARRRILTVYTDVRRVTAALNIADCGTIWLYLVDREGRVRWRGSGAFDPSTAAGLAAALDTENTSEEKAEQFEFAFDPRFRLPLAALGITPSTAHFTIGPDRLLACFGPWVVRTAPSNVRAVCITGPYRSYRAIGARLSMADRGLTFGSSVGPGVCMLFRDPVRGFDPLGLLRHPGLTVTVARPEALAAAVHRYCDLTNRSDRVSPLTSLDQGT